MTPVQRGANWPAVGGIALTAVLNMAAFAYFTGSMSEKVQMAIKRMDIKDAKDEMQDGRINALEPRVSITENDIQALKDGRYNNVIQRLPNTPSFGP